jgi:hypothetical protein
LIQALYLFPNTAQSSKRSIIDNAGARALRATTEYYRRDRGKWQIVDRKWQIVDSNPLVLIIDCNG